MREGMAGIMSQIQGEDTRRRSLEKQRKQDLLTGVANHLLAAVFALAFGGLGYALAVFDLGLGESWPVRAVAAALFFFLGGFGFGYFNPDGWLIAGLTAWGCVYLGVLSVVAALNSSENVSAVRFEPPVYVGLILLFAPLGLALLGGYLGKNLKLRRRAESEASV
jgi:hypothetical protein